LKDTPETTLLLPFFNFFSWEGPGPPSHTRPFGTRRCAPHPPLLGFWIRPCVKQRILNILIGQYIPMSSLIAVFWLFDIYISKLKGPQACTKFDVHQAKNSQRNWVVSIFLCPVWPMSFDFLISKLKGDTSIYFLDVPVYKVWCLSNKGSSTYWAVSIFLYPVWPLIFLISKLKGVINSFGHTNVPSLMSIKQTIHKISKGQFIPLSCLTSKSIGVMYQYTKIQNGSQDMV
jgi:hypothetical protein